MKQLWLLSIVTLSASAVQAMPLGAPAAPIAAIAVHGCHGHYSHDTKGWHRHGKHCETQRGLVRAKHGKKRAFLAATLNEHQGRMPCTRPAAHQPRNQTAPWYLGLGRAPAIALTGVKPHSVFLS